MRAFMIVRGEYSDYAVWAICVDEVLAYRLVGHLNQLVNNAWDLFRVEEHPLLDDFEDGVASLEMWLRSKKGP